MVDKVSQGKRNRRKGLEFERMVRKYIIGLGWVVDNWTNNIDLETGEIVQAKTNRFMARSCGFPDFMTFKKAGDGEKGRDVCYLQFVECKTNGKLSKIEKMKMNVLVKKGFRCYVASKMENGVKIEEFFGYEDKS